MKHHPSTLPEEQQEMTFWEHLEELRGTLWRILIAIFIASIVAFSFKDILFDDIILAPKSKGFITYRILCALGRQFSMPSLCVDPSAFQLININLAGQFTSHLNISLVAGLIISLPYVLWELWRFIKPGLTETEIRNSRGAVAIVSLLFLLGVVFSYFIVAPLMINFLGGYLVSPTVTNQIALTSYISSITLMTLLMGLLFELPVLILFLTRIGIVTPKYLRKYRKHTAVAILIIAGIITPSPDVFSQLIVAVPLYALFEFSVIVSSRIYKKSHELAG
ncbi:MAG: twin-arginine translocase subunit TatC [Bacteroidales bacterium]|jgi:sec-independent protein translocase protein TatC|nr:twin-arginine translocase subunit TatC [Bacteroidales bacterium]